MSQNSLQKWPGLRIIVPDKQAFLTETQSINLFWIKDGYLYCGIGAVKGAVASRALMLLQQWLPVKELNLSNVEWRSEIRDSAECFYVDPLRGLEKSVYQRRSVKSWLSFFIKMLLGENWRKKYQQIWPVFPVRQIDNLKIGNSREFANKLLKEF